MLMLFQVSRLNERLSWTDGSMPTMLHALIVSTGTTGYDTMISTASSTTRWGIQSSLIAVMIGTNQRTCEAVVGSLLKRPSNNRPHTGTVRA